MLKPGWSVAGLLSMEDVIKHQLSAALSAVKILRTSSFISDDERGGGEGGGRRRREKFSDAHQNHSKSLLILAALYI